MNYQDFIWLMNKCEIVISDSGGVQEEAPTFGKPVLVLRDSTERPETCSIGTNELTGTNEIKIKKSFTRLFNNNWKSGGIPALWDGNAASRIVDELINIFVK